MHTNFYTAGLGVVRRWYIAKPSTRRTLNHLCDLEPHPTFYIVFALDDPDTLRHVYTKLSLRFLFARNAARPTVTASSTALPP